MALRLVTNGKQSSPRKVKSRSRADAGASIDIVRSVETGAVPLFEEDMRTAVQQLKRERIIAAAVDLFELHGFNQTSVDLIAEQLGATKPVIYAQFGTKSKLLGEICSRAMRIALEAIDAALSNRSSPREQLELFASGLMAGVMRSGKHLAIYMREEKNLAAEELKVIKDLRRQVDKKLVDILRRGVQAGHFEIADERLAAMAIGGIATWIGMRLGPDARFQPDDVTVKVVPLILALAGAKAVHRRE